MAKLFWGQTKDKRYEYGVDRGVLYNEEQPGVAWNGIVSVNESFDGGTLQSYYFDGIKTLDLVTPREFRAKIEAFGSPREFRPCDGFRELTKGIIATRQPRSRFGFSYRTKVGGTNSYKIHLVYNATATRDAQSFQTISNVVSPTKYSWTIRAVPPPSQVFRPTAHLVIDSRRITAEALYAIESKLYGTKTDDPWLPPQTGIFDIIDAAGGIDGGIPTSTFSGHLDGGFPSSQHMDQVDGGTSYDHG